MKAPLLAEAEIGVRWDGALAIKEITDQHLLLEGRKVYFEETMAVFEKLYPGVTAEVLEEKMDPVEDDLMPRQAYKGEIDPVVVKVKVMGLG
jgi:hypothetical protein